jgi:hypothetical protein
MHGPHQGSPSRFFFSFPATLKNGKPNEFPRFSPNFERFRFFKFETPDFGCLFSPLSFFYVFYNYFNFLKV